MFLNFYLHKGQIQLSEAEALRHYRKAFDAIEDEVKNRPNDLNLLIKFADILHKVEKATYRLGKKKDEVSIVNNPNLNRAKSYYLQALKIQPTDSKILLSFAQFLYFWSDFDAAEEYFLQALEVDPNLLEALQSYGKLLLSERKKPIGAIFMTRHSNILAQQNLIENFLQNKINGSQAAEMLKSIEEEHTKSLVPFKSTKDFSHNLLRSLTDGLFK